MFSSKSFSLALIALTGCASAPAKAEKPSFHFLPDSAYSKIVQYAAEYASNPPLALEKIQSVLCNGKSPRFDVVYSTTVRPPSTTGVGLDVAASDRADFVNGVRTFFKDKFFHVSANNDPDMRKNGLIYRQFLDNGSQTIGVPYAQDMDMLVHDYAFVLPKEFITSQFNNIVQKDWSDMAALSWYGFVLNRNNHMEFSASKAISNNWNIWEGVMANSTSIFEAAQQDGSIKFTIKMSLKSYCSYAVPIYSLISS